LIAAGAANDLASPITISAVRNTYGQRSGAGTPQNLQIVTAAPLSSAPK
jgi:hypothetical protein